MVDCTLSTDREGPQIGLLLEPAGVEVEAERSPVGGVVPLEVGHEHLELRLLVLHLGTVVHHRTRVVLVNGDTSCASEHEPAFI